MVLIVLGFVVLFPLFWISVFWLLSRLSGWGRLAESFPHRFEPTGDILLFASARVGWVDYSAALILGVGEEGLYLVPMWLFRPFHAPVLVPWTQIEADAREGRRIPRVKLTFPGTPAPAIGLYGREAQRCLPYLRPEA